MKKIICLILALVCVVACASCNNSGESQNPILGNKGTLETVRDTVNNSSPTRIVTRTEYVGKETLEAMYTTQIDRESGKSQFDFKYERYATVEEMLAGSIKTVEGTVYYNADGSVSSSDGESWDSKDTLTYLPENLNLEEIGFKSYEIVDNGNDLKGYIASSDSKRVFGSKIDADGDIMLEIDTNGMYLYNIKITYTAKDTGATVVVNTSYDYSAVTIA